MLRTWWARLRKVEGHKKEVFLASLKEIDFPLYLSYQVIDEGMSRLEQDLANLQKSIVSLTKTVKDEEAPEKKE